MPFKNIQRLGFVTEPSKVEGEYIVRMTTKEEHDAEATATNVEEAVDEESASSENQQSSKKAFIDDDEPFVSESVTDSVDDGA